MDKESDKRPTYTHLVQLYTPDPWNPPYMDPSKHNASHPYKIEWFQISIDRHVHAQTQKKPKSSPTTNKIQPKAFVIQPFWINSIVAAITSKPSNQHDGLLQLGRLHLTSRSVLIQTRIDWCGWWWWKYGVATMKDYILMFVYILLKFFFFLTCPMPFYYIMMIVNQYCISSKGVVLI